MVQFNFNERTIKAKVVYYGPAQSGKTTNLEQIHRLTDPDGTNRLISLNTAQDRTLFFDLLPFSLGAVSGYDFQVQLYTVPGQVQYNATRRVVLAGADAVVFVADSRQNLLKENLAAFENMRVNLLANRLVPEKVPIVFQYNKQDLPDLVPREELDAALNAWGRPSFSAVASTAEGVMETFAAVVQEMLGSIALKYNLKEKGLDPAAVPEMVTQALAAVLPRASSVPPPALPSRVVVSQQTDSLHAVAPSASPESGLVSEELLQRAIRSSVQLAEDLAGLVRDMNVGLSTILSHAELIQTYRDEARDKRAAGVQKIQEEAHRLRALVRQLGQPLDAAAGVPPAGRPEASTASSGLEGVLRRVLGDVGELLELRGLAVELRIAPRTELPRCPPDALHQALARLLEGVAAASPPRVAVAVRCERKPVILRGRDGEVKQDFLMLAVAHQGGPSTEEQQRIMQGAASGALGEAARLCRELGGFVRFAPLPDGGLETRVFLPA